jgi:hypothetical protein
MSTITVPTTLTAISTSAFGAPVANQLNQQIAFVSFTPGGSTNTAASGTWLTIGNQTVPTWATKAIIQCDCTILAGSAANASATVQAQLGSSLGTPVHRWTQQVVSTRFMAAATWQCTGISTGSQSLTLQAANVSGNLTADTATIFAFVITYLG